MKLHSSQLKEDTSLHSSFTLTFITYSTYRVPSSPQQSLARCDSCIDDSLSKNQPLHSPKDKLWQ